MPRHGIGIACSRSPLPSPHKFRAACILVGDTAAIQPPLSHGSQQRPHKRAFRLAQSQHIAHLERIGRPYIVDPVIEPINFGFPAALDRYVQVRARYPDAEMLMGIGNITELTDADTTGVNALLIGFCQELAITSVLTTAVINWARSSVRELDLARRLMHHAVARRVLPKHIEPRLVMLSDPKVARFGSETLADLAARIKDPNWRVFAEDGKLLREGDGDRRHRGTHHLPQSRPGLGRAQAA